MIDWRDVDSHGDPTAAPPGRALILRLESTGETRRLARGTLDIGRAEGNDWLIDASAAHSRVSSRHCSFVADNDGFSLIDRRSTNGTFLNEQRVMAMVAAPVTSGDVVAIGGHRLLLGIEAADDSTAGPGREHSPQEDDGGPGLAGDEKLHSMLDFLFCRTEGDAAPSTQTAGDTDADSLLAHFLIGAGIDPASIEIADPAAFLHDAGRAFAAMADGLRELLAVQTRVAFQARARSFVVGREANNHLRNAVDRREAVAGLLLHQNKNDLPQAAAVHATIRDLCAHELAMLDGCQAAATELLAAVDPARLETQTSQQSGLGHWLPGGQSARLWELYLKRYGDIARAAKTQTIGMFADAFRQAYEKRYQAIARDRAKPGDSP